jgi:hypothetical protein
MDRLGCRGNFLSIHRCLHLHLERRFDDTSTEIAYFISRCRFEEVETVLTKYHTFGDKRVRDKNQQVRSLDSWNSKRKLFVPSRQRLEESFENTLPCVLHVKCASSTPTAIIDPYLSSLADSGLAARCTLIKMNTESGR